MRATVKPIGHKLQVSFLVCFQPVEKDVWCGPALAWVTIGNKVIALYESFWGNYQYFHSCYRAPGPQLKGF